MEQNKKILFSAPVLKEKEIGKRWYLEFYVQLPGGVRQRIKLSAGINRGKTVDQRRTLADRVLKNWDPHKYYSGGSNAKLPVLAGKDERLIIEIEQFIKSQTSWKFRTIQTYRTILNDFYRWLRNHSRNNISPASFSSDDASSYAKYLIESGHSNVTHNSRKAFLFSVWKYWQVYKPDLNVIRNPWQAVRSLPDTKKPKKIFTISEKKLLKDYISKQHPQLMFFIEYAYYCFLRPPAELRMLKVGDHDLVNNIINVSASSSKTNKKRVHAIPKVFQDRVNQLRGFDVNFYVFGKGGVPGPIPLPKNRMINLHRQVLDELGFGNSYSLYSWRHTAACELYIASKDIKLVQMAMAHTSVATTERYLRGLGVVNDQRLFDRMEL